MTLADPTYHHESTLPLFVAAVVAILAHLVAVPHSVAWLTENTMVSADPDSRQVDHEPETDNRFGRDNSRPATVAWISHDDFEQLIAPPGQTHQPAVQQEIDPLVHAPTPPTAASPLPTPSSAITQ